jgi:glycerol-3-phosphate dehydrogenase
MEGRKMAKTAFDKVIEKLQKGKCDVEMAEMPKPEKP